ncbi:hypothetical protein RO3G_12356 [Rhizopus delemar RA 99-880]|uniref:Uncharacterized protein n=1 Tax=Rhizopus delemar (strain RA 99-880 / ATCC MYA-4621 / FGSC 9543 / NRRL 43880) TaxID=246409 RepID=I1CGR5_RHIO9|nr:hypothetical protein RO3G_12356 [Rhizopus delemar RA 99-880]|eukprot:EIE87645.1 hypothetical protein RO3G_12356 [Rhizopus delemar RA 99-880]
MSSVNSLPKELLLQHMQCGKKSKYDQEKCLSTASTDLLALSIN